jgi:hypothetical protein
VWVLPAFSFWLRRPASPSPGAANLVAAAGGVLYVAFLIAFARDRASSIRLRR